MKKVNAGLRPLVSLRVNEGFMAMFFASLRMTLREFRVDSKNSLRALCG